MKGYGFAIAALAFAFWAWRRWQIRSLIQEAERYANNPSEYNAG